MPGSVETKPVDGRPLPLVRSEVLEKVTKARTLLHQTTVGDQIHPYIDVTGLSNDELDVVSDERIPIRVRDVRGEVVVPAVFAGETHPHFSKLHSLVSLLIPHRVHHHSPTA